MSFVSALEAPASISNAIKKASHATGTDFSYLLKTAARESAFNKGAKAKTSSAAGLFQFIESTWLKTVKDVGDKFGLDNYTPHIFKTRSGKYYVPNRSVRQEILQLRHNPEVSALMAGAFTQRNAEIVSSSVGRAPTDGELYIAHFLGAKGAGKLISLAENNPNTRADRQFPAAARANRSIFYSRGRARTVAQVYENLVRHHEKTNAQASTAVASNPTPNAPVASAKNQPFTSKKVTPANLVSPVQSPVTPKTAEISDAEIEPPAPGAIARRPARQIIPTEQDIRFLTHTVNYAERHALPTPEPLGEGVETAVIPPVQRNSGVGLVGQSGSPSSEPARTASLQQGANIKLQETNPPSTGSIGVWTTIVQTPSDVPESITPEEAKATDEARPADQQSERRRSRAPGLLEQSAQREAAVELAARGAVDRFKSANFWDLVQADGN